MPRTVGLGERVRGGPDSLRAGVKKRGLGVLTCPHGWEQGVVWPQVFGALPK